MITHIFKNARLLQRYVHTSNKPITSYKVMISKNEDYFIVNHPEVEHPYSYTRPLPKENDVSNEETILRENAKNMFTKSPNLEQLQSLTYTPARYWHQYPGKVKRLKYKACQDDNVDRQGLTS